MNRGAQSTSLCTPGGVIARYFAKSIEAASTMSPWCEACGHGHADAGKWFIPLGEGLSTRSFESKFGFAMAFQRGAEGCTEYRGQIYPHDAALPSTSLGTGLGKEVVPLTMPCDAAIFKQQCHPPTTEHCRVCAEHRRRRSFGEYHMKDRSPPVRPCIAIHIPNLTSRSSRSTCTP